MSSEIHTKYETFFCVIVVSNFIAYFVSSFLHVDIVSKKRHSKNDKNEILKIFECVKYMRFFSIASFFVMSWKIEEENMLNCYEQQQGLKHQ